MKIVILFFLLFTMNSYAAPIKDFHLEKYTDGKEFKLNDYLGKQIIVINFWASWCTSCIQELPELQALKSKYNDALYIAINNGEKKKIIKKFLKRHQFEYLILMDPEKNVAKLYGIESLPHTLVISKNKKITYLGIRPPKSLPLP